MKLKLKGGDWNEVGELVEARALTFHKVLGKGHVFVSANGAQVFLTEQDLANIGGGEPETTPRFQF